jgi:flavin reductase (DIM6/NTAB) family NADH-FMN oxidoreductase RutF
MRQAVDLPHAYRLLNHGPTVLVSAAHAGQRNVMAAAWAMPLDFSPPKVAVVIDRNTFTRGLVEASGQFVLSVPCVAGADAAFTVGSVSARDLDGLDKFRRYGLTGAAGSVVDAPLLDGCVAWLECRLLAEPGVQQQYDLFLGEVLAAWADARVFSAGRWHFSDDHAGLRTLHHVAGGAFVVAGPTLQAKMLP